MEHGRNRQSLTDIEEQLREVFEANPAAEINDEGVPVIPGGELPVVVAEFSSRFGTVLLSQVGIDMMQTFATENAGVPITPHTLLELVANLTAPSRDKPPSPPPKDSLEDPRSDSSGASSPNTELRGRGEGTPSRALSRTSSNDSGYHQSATPLASRTTPQSPFDSSLRQRSTPLSAAAPSAWTRKPLPASRRRKSDSGSIGGNRSSSDNESSPAIARRSSRGPSNPVSPRNAPLQFPASGSSPLDSSDNGRLPAARRTQSFDHSTGMSQTLVDDFPAFSRSSKSKSPNAPVIKFHSGSGSDDDTDLEHNSDDEDATHRYVRQALSSDASLQPEDRVEALQKANTDLGRRLADLDRQSQLRLAERETEIADLESQLDDLKVELSVSRREEKELRVKERASMTQFSSFESEIQKLQKSLEHARTQYSSMQKQYQEQCTETERMRNVLRRKEQEIKEADDRAYMHEGEVQKWSREREALENSIESLELELNTTRQAVNELDEQKQENLLLKETIDRMRFDLDALRAGMGPSAAHEGQGTLSRSLANEIREGFERREREREEAEDRDVEDGVVVEHEEGEGSDDGYIETTITTSRKRKVGTRSKPTTRLDDETMREYVDASAQHDASEFLTTSGVQHQHSEFVSESGVQHLHSEFSNGAEVQTDSRAVRDMETATDPPRLKDAETATEPPRMKDAETETEAREVRHVESGTESPEVREVQTEAQAGVECAVGTDEVRGVEMGVGAEAPEVVHAGMGTEAEVEPEPERMMCEMEVQTDDVPVPAPAAPRSPTPVDESKSVSGPSDLPPPYPQEVEASVLKRWHARRAHRAPKPEHVREEWAALKRLVGVECQVIERIIEGEDVDDFVDGQSEDDAGDDQVKREVRERAPTRTRRLFRVCFEVSWWPCLLTHAVLGVGIWTFVAGVVVSQFAQYPPTYADRMTWSAYNNYAGALGEGLVGRSGDSAIWTAIERLVMGAAVRVGPGLPT